MQTHPDSRKRSSIMDRVVIVGIILLVISPILYWISSPTQWSYAAALQSQRDGDFETAEKSYLEIIKSDPKHAMALFRLGELAFQRKDYELSLQYATESIACVHPSKMPPVINLKTNSLIAIGKKQAAVESVFQLFQFTTLPKEFESLGSDELSVFMKDPGNRHFLNSLAYVMAITETELVKAEKFMDVVIGYFEREADQARLTVPYLLERSSEYQQAFDSLQVLAMQIKQDNQQQFQEEEFSEAIRLVAPEQVANMDAEQIAEARSKLVNLEKKAQRELLFIVFNRLQLLSEKLDRPDSQSFEAEMQQLKSPNISRQKCRVEIDDKKFMSFAYEQQPYYDTRAMVRLRLGDQVAANALKHRGNNMRKFMLESARASEYYEKGYQDLMESIAIRSATNTFVEKYPDNSLLIRLPSDDQMIERQQVRMQAIEHYHRFLLLTALDRLDEAEGFLNRVEALGFEANPLLF